MFNFYNKFSQFCSSLVLPIANLWARIYIGWSVFFVSGLAKLDDFEDTMELFEEDWIVPFLPSQMSAYLATAGELILPVLLILGLFTRLGALGLLCMTIVIQVWVLQDPQHYLWMIILCLLIGQGGHKLSLDNWLFKQQ